MKLLRHFQKATTTLLLASGICMLVGSAGLLSAHARAVRSMRDVSLPLVAELPVLERRLSILTQQVEMAEIQTSVRLGSQQEQIVTFVLPVEPDLDRLFAFFDVVRDQLERGGHLDDFSDIAIGDTARAPVSGLSVRPIRLKFSAHEKGLETLATLVQLAGLLTVGDTLTMEERRTLLTQTEAENPAGIIALEQFLSIDLLRYARDPRSYEDQLLRSFPSTAFLSAFRAVTQSSLLADARTVLGGGIGQALERQNLWPLPMLRAQSVALDRGSSEGWSRVEMVVGLYTRNHNDS